MLVRKKVTLVKIHTDYNSENKMFTGRMKVKKKQTPGSFGLIQREFSQV